MAARTAPSICATAPAEVADRAPKTTLPLPDSVTIFVYPNSENTDASSAMKTSLARPTLIPQSSAMYRGMEKGWRGLGGCGEKGNSP